MFGSIAVSIMPNSKILGFFGENSHISLRQFWRVEIQASGRGGISSMSRKSSQRPKKKETPPPRKPKSRVAVGWTAIILIAAALILGVMGLLWFRSGNRGEQTVASNATIIAREVGYEVVNQFPHDAGAFLQGLVWHNGFFESTGQFGR